MTRRSRIGALLPGSCLTLAVLSQVAGCARPAAEPSACDGLSDKTIGITRADYSECAGEILEALKRLEPPMRRLVLKGDETARPEAVAAYRRLRHVMRQVGFQQDIWREVGGGAGRTVERWPNGNMQHFNLEVTGAATHFNSALRFPHEDNFREASAHHARARQAYARFR
jgi:hypothetical protein